MNAPQRQRLIAGFALVVLGLGLYWLHVTRGIREAAVFFVVGGAFLAAYLARRNFGFLVPAGILLGMGAGLIGRGTIFDFGKAQLLGLGCGFVSIYLIALLYERRNVWWPLFPGGALILLGFPQAENVFIFFYRNWPLLLVIAGVLVMLGAFGRPSRGGGSNAAS
jgi:hypothetical protein